GGAPGAAGDVGWAEGGGSGQHPEADVGEGAVAAVVDLDVDAGGMAGVDPAGGLGEGERARPAVVLQLDRLHRLLPGPRGDLDLDVGPLPPRAAGPGTSGGGAAGAEG